MGNGGVGVAVGIEVDVAVAVAVEVEVGVAVGVDVGVDVEVDVAVGVAVFGTLTLVGAIVVSTLVDAIAVAEATEVATTLFVFDGGTIATPADPSTIKRGEPPMMQPPEHVAPARSMVYWPFFALIVCLRPLASINNAVAAWAGTLIVTCEG